MPPQPNARHSNADGGKGRADHPDTRNEYGAQPRPTTRKSQGLNSTQTGFKPETSIATPVFQAGLATRLQSRCYLSEYVKKQLIHKHEKPIRDKHDEDVKALGEGSTGAHPGHDGIPDRNSLEETARAGLQAGLKAVQPAIATELKALDDLITSEYQPLIRMYMINDVKNRLATLKRDKESRARGQPVMFTRAEVAEAEEVWKAKRISLGLPLEGNLDDLDPGEMVREQSEGLDFTAEEDSSTDSSVEGQSDDEGHDDLMDLELECDEEEEEEEESQSSVTVDGHETSELES